MNISRTIHIDQKVKDMDELVAFNEYFLALVITISHTPYTVSVERVDSADEEKELRLTTGH